MSNRAIERLPRSRPSRSIRSVFNNLRLHFQLHSNNSTCVNIHSLYHRYHLFHLGYRKLRPAQIIKFQIKGNHPPSPTRSTSPSSSFSGTSTSTIPYQLPSTPPASPTPPHRSPSSDSAYDYMANRVLDYIEDNLEYYLSPLPPDFQEYENHINDYFLPEE